MLGNQVFSGKPIYATQRTLEILLERRSEIEADVRKKNLEQELRELEARARAEVTEAGVGRTTWCSTLVGRS